jgi:predicted nucleic acid-binding Zn ribbon protein
VRLKPLSDRVLEALPRFDHAPLAAEVAAYLNFDIPRVRAAFETLEASGKARIVRRGRGLHLVPVSSPIRICPICRGEIAGRGRTCSKSCGMRVAWTKRDRARQAEVFRETHRRLPEKMKAGLASLLGTPTHREHLRRLQQKLWGDPVHKMQRLVAIEEAWKGEKAAPRREKARARKQAAWASNRAALVEGMRRGRRGRYQREVIRLLAEVPGITDAEVASRTGRTLEQTKLLMRRLFKQGMIHRAPVDGRKSRLSA